MQTDFDDLRGRIVNRLASGQLNDWQERFLSDIARRIDRYGSRTRLTPRQIEKLAELIGPVRSTNSNIIAFKPGRRFHRRRRRSSWLTWFLRRNAPILLIVILAVTVGYIYDQNGDGRSWLPFGGLHATSTIGAPMHLHPSQIAIVDGDTIRISGENRRFRLVGFNTPEVTSPQCARERELGDKATRRLQELVQSGDVVLQRVACSCRPGTEGTNECNFGRLCGKLTVAERDVGSILISEGLAVSFVCGRTSCPRLGRPWCG